MVKSITSPVNPLIKKIVQLCDKSKARKDSATFVIEGKKEILLALKGGYIPNTIIFNPTIVGYNSLLDLYGNILFEVEMIEVTNLVYNKIAYREGTEGVIGIFRSKELLINQIEIDKPDPLILVAEAPEKPGNIGALLRTADAAGVDLFMLANPNTDIYNPNIIRSSVGTVFTNQVAIGSSSQIITFLKERKIRIYCAIPDPDSVSCYKYDFKGPTAIVVGTESSGLSQEWINSADAKLVIPMKGQIDSLNVSVSAAILIFEAIRQRSR
ncbi:MAG: RNA methyltransferase [Saprospiraceae bacterium]|jgi:TrmH family RNA methyltransferase|nr:RNA methyltransferase [Saprospiraceae bacterium]